MASSPNGLKSVSQSSAPTPVLPPAKYQSVPGLPGARSDRGLRAAAELVLDDAAAAGHLDDDAGLGRGEQRGDGGRAAARTRRRDSTGAGRGAAARHHGERRGHGVRGDVGDDAPSRPPGRRRPRCPPAQNHGRRDRVRGREARSGARGRGRGSEGWKGARPGWRRRAANAPAATATSTTSRGGRGGCRRGLTPAPRTRRRCRSAARRARRSSRSRRAAPAPRPVPPGPVWSGDGLAPPPEQDEQPEHALEADELVHAALAGVGDRAPGRAPAAGTGS